MLTNSTDGELYAVDWNTVSKLGLIQRINKEILHPLGLAMTRHPDTGTSPLLIVASDGKWSYPPDYVFINKTEEEIKEVVSQESFLLTEDIVPQSTGEN